MPRYRIRNYSNRTHGFYEDPPEKIEGVDNAALPVHIRPAETRIVTISGAQERDARLHEKLREISMEEVGEDEADEVKTPEEIAAAQRDEATRRSTASTLGPADGPRDEYDDMTDESLRAFITTRDGKAPHPATGRIKLLDRARNAPKGEDASEADDTDANGGEAV